MSLRRAPTLLCVPAHKPDLYRKAADTGASILMFDLEDSVPEQHKARARSVLTSFLDIARYQLQPGQRTAVRINPRCSADLNLFDDTGIDFLVIPKVRTASDITPYGMGNQLVAVIETAEAITNLRSIVPCLAGAIFGIADFAASMGMSDRIYGSFENVDRDSHARFAYARQKLAVYCAAAGIGCFDTCFNVRSAVDICRSWHGSRSYGFTGAACIHPLQVQIAQSIFGAGALKEVSWSHDIIAGHTTRQGEVGVDKQGQVVGLPVVRQAEAILGVKA
jgi:citrate lyase subunit beta/citryl-CoA lyase